MFDKQKHRQGLSKELQALYTPDGRIDGGRALEYVYKMMKTMSDEEFHRIATMPTPLRLGPMPKVKVVKFSSKHKINPNIPPGLSKELQALYLPDGRIDGERALLYVHKAIKTMSNEEFFRIVNSPVELRLGPISNAPLVQNSRSEASRRLKSKLRRARGTKKC